MDNIRDCVKKFTVIRPEPEPINYEVVEIPAFAGMTEDFTFNTAPIFVERFVIDHQK